MNDSIEIRGIECFGHHGVHAEERRLGQRFVLDLVLYLDVRSASNTDDLARGVDYGQVVRRAREIAEGEPCRLIETLAERLAQALLHAFPSVMSIETCVHKPNAPIPGAPVGDIAVRVLRERTW